ncbi:MAG: GNAT family N-acetyltransferase [Gammaproteobacteria bacterium]|jgi:predicted N-acyltransferase
MTFLTDLSSLSESSNLFQKSHYSNNPFERIEYYKNLELTGCAAKNSGWMPNHVYVDSSKGSLLIPTYQKLNSYGEFIFDYVWANAFTQHGINYYPKLVSTVPFTPCHSNKIIGNAELINEAIVKVTDFMIQQKLPTWHILFPSDQDIEILNNSKFIKRYGFRFIWKNYAYKSFEDYLDKFKSRQRKNIKKERESIADAGINFEIIEGDKIQDRHWEKFFNFYCQTYFDRGQSPYLNLDFFKSLSLFNPKISPLIFFAKNHNEFVGAALCFRGGNTLYGRHWGSTILLKNLHFEACYYQGIEYCINNNIANFDPGIQGEHKLRRGFEVHKKCSLHLILDKDFRQAIEHFCMEEEKHIDQYIASCKNYTPFSNDGRIKE